MQRFPPETVHNKPALLSAELSELRQLGELLLAHGEAAAAAKALQNVVSSGLRDPVALNLLGIAYTRLQELPKAVQCFQTAVTLQPDFLLAHYNLGEALKGQGLFAEAEKSLTHALKLRDGFPEAWCCMGDVLWMQSRGDEAIASYQKAIALNPAFARSYINLTELYKSRNEIGLAESLIRKLLALNSQIPEAHYLLGVMLYDQERLSEAVVCFNIAASMKQDFWHAHWWFAMTRLSAEILGMVKPDAALPIDNILPELDRTFANAAATAEGYRIVGIVQPFYAAYRATNHRQLFSCYGTLCCRLMQHWQTSKGLQPRTLQRQGRVRVGIVSSQIYKQSVYVALIKGWLKHLDHALIDIHVFSLGKRSDHETMQARESGCKFIEGHASLEKWVETILAAEPEVLIYPEIGMDPMTLRLACLRLAPLQMASWGHPETTGLPTIDYYVSAELLENNNADDNYTEKLLRLPGLGSCYGNFESAAVDIALDRLGLSAERPLLLCPGYPCKYAPEHDWIFVELARRIDGGQLVFFSYPGTGFFSAHLKQRLQTLFIQEGLVFERCVRFIPWQEEPAFFGLMRKATVFLDTIGFSGFNTAMQAVACNLPIVTMDGEFLRGKLASGILKRIGLDALIADSPAAYIALVERLVRDAEFNRAIRASMENGKSVLFDDATSVAALQDFLIAKCR